MDPLSAKCPRDAYKPLVVGQSGRVRFIFETLGLDQLYAGRDPSPAFLLNESFSDLCRWLTPDDSVRAARRLQAFERFPVAIFRLFNDPFLTQTIDDGKELIPVLADLLTKKTSEGGIVLRSVVQQLVHQRSLLGTVVYEDAYTHAGYSTMSLGYYAAGLALLSQPVSLEYLPKTDRQWEAFYKILRHCFDDEIRKNLRQLSTDIPAILIMASQDWTKWANKFARLGIDATAWGIATFAAPNIVLPTVFEKCANEIEKPLRLGDASKVIDCIRASLQICFKDVRFSKLYQYTSRFSNNQSHVAAALAPYDKMKSIPDLICEWPSFFQEQVHRGIRIVPLDSRHKLSEDGRMQRHCVGLYAPDCIEGTTAYFSLRDADTDERLATVSVRPETSERTSESCCWDIKAAQNQEADLECKRIGRLLYSTLAFNDDFRSRRLHTKNLTFEQTYGFSPDDKERARLVFQEANNHHCLPHADGLTEPHEWLDRIGFFPIHRAIKSTFDIAV